MRIFSVFYETQYSIFGFLLYVPAVCAWPSALWFVTNSSYGIIDCSQPSISTFFLKCNFSQQNKIHVGFSLQCVHFSQNYYKNIISKNYINRSWVLVKLHVFSTQYVLCESIFHGNFLSSWCGNYTFEFAYRNRQHSVYFWHINALKRTFIMHVFLFLSSNLKDDAKFKKKDFRYKKCL